MDEPASGVRAARGPLGWGMAVLAAGLVAWAVWASSTGVKGEPGEHLDVALVPLRGASSSAPLGDVRPDEGVLEAVVAVPAIGVTPQVTADGGLPVEAVLVDPGRYVGGTIRGTALVVDVPSGRCFVVEHAGERVLVVLKEEPLGEALGVGRGRRVVLQNATVRRALTDLSGSVDPFTRRALEDQPVFLTAARADVRLAG